MTHLPLPDSAVRYVLTASGKSTKEFYNWLKSVDVTLRENAMLLRTMQDRLATLEAELMMNRPRPPEGG